MPRLTPQSIANGAPGTRLGRRCVFALWGLLLILAPGWAGADERVSERELRAVYLYNFSAFITWPDSAFASGEGDFRYCVLGNRALGKLLAGVLEGESVQGRGLRLVDATQPAQWRQCQLLYVDPDMSDMASSVLRAVEGLPVLTVTGSREVMDQGFMTALVRQGRRVKPVVHRQRVQAAGIRISSKLLRLSILVGDGEPD